MRAFAGLAVLALTVARPVSALDWSQGDPVDQVRAELKTTAAPAAPALRGGGSAGQFDSYVFALEWTPAFCEGKSGLPECSSLTPDSFAANNLGLHGLWPDQSGDPSHNYGYCGVDSRTQSLDKAATWCRMPDFGLSDAGLSRLTPEMPGTASCLQNHEWYKHGSCSGYAPDEYFGRAADLVAQVASTSFGRYLTAHVGQTVSASDLLDAWESDFGAGSRRYVALSCTSANGASLLLDVRVHLAVPLRPASELAAMLSPVAASGNCPGSFLIDAAR